MATMPAGLEQFMGKMLGDMGAAISGALIVLGDRLGLYRTLGTSPPMTAAELDAWAHKVVILFLEGYKGLHE